MQSLEGPIEWLTFPAPDDDGRQFRVNVSFLLSTYRCIYGQGCPVHRLALRTGRHPADTKPEICWSIPLNYSAEEPVEPGGRETTIISAFSTDAWGGHAHWWCIDQPDAYVATEPVYLTFEYEL